MMNTHVIIERLVVSLQQFSPEIGENWCCPTCLRVIPRSQPNEATEAHIVPKAAGGSITTALCKQCNDQFGAQQDRWLGEFLRMLRSNQPFPFSPPTRSNFFEIDGVRVGGRYDIQPDTGVRLIIDVQRTNPAILRDVLRSSLIKVLSRRLTQQSPVVHTVSFPIPILRHKELIEIGFLTAAYLLWFRALGYSWALQQHLEPIREQIRNPRRQVLPPKFSAICEEHMFDPPWIGVGEVSGELTLLAGIWNHIVFLPPADRPNFYEALPDDFQGLSFDLPRTLQFYTGHQFGGPVGILFGTRAIVVPDVLRTGSAQGQLIYCPPEGGAPQLLYPIPHTHYERVLRSPDVVHIDVRWPVE